MTLAVPAGFDDVLDAARPLADAFHAAGRRVFLVGGVVRDHWLGIDRHDNDLDATTDARPPEIKQIVAPLADAVWTQGERFGTIGCRIAGREYEITTHRTEVYASHSRKPDVVFGDRIDDDLARRDFTVNAMAVDLNRRELVDPFDGRGDLERRVLRTPLAPEVAFSEDPLRMLRAARFHAGYGLVPTSGLAAAVRAMGDRMGIVSVERTRIELDKLLLLADPAPGLLFLSRTGLMRWVIPELAGVDHGSVERVARRVAAVPATSAMRWAAFVLGVPDPDERLRALRFSNDHIVAVEALHAARAWLDDEAVPTGAPAVRRAAAAVRVPIDEVITFLRAVRRARNRDDVALAQLADEIAELRITEPDLDDPAPLLPGSDVMAVLGLGEGREVGEAMDWLRELRLDLGPISRDEAIRRLRGEWERRRRG